MKRFLVVALVALSLGACSTIKAVTGATVTQTQVDVTRSAYNGGFLAGLHRYALLPRCLAGQTFLRNQCHDPATLRKLRAVDKTVEQNFGAVQANISVGNDSALLNSWTVLNNTITSANTLAAQLGLQ